MAPDLTPRGFRYFRRIQLGRPRDRKPMTAVRRDGTTVDIRRSLGLPSVPAAPDPMADDAPGWRPA